MSAEQTTGTDPSGGDGFGVNRWLVDELYEQYREDPDSLSPSWQEFFEDYRPETPLGRGPDTGVETTEDDQAAVRARAKEEAAERDDAAEREDAARKEAERAAAADGEAAEQEVEEEADEEAEGEAEDVEAAPERIRGIKAAIAQNMEKSLAVPTATSVRTVPAKLLEVNRRIANNYLRRTYGGKVSFTHIIAYAAVKALDAVPNMRSTYAEVDGKPGIVRREHVNLGLAVDVERDEAPSIIRFVLGDDDKACESHPPGR
jgi:multifunctional 2-oxoglutarate metabolism enzyme